MDTFYLVVAFAVIENMPTLGCLGFSRNLKEIIDNIIPDFKDAPNIALKIVNNENTVKSEFERLNKWFKSFPNVDDKMADSMTANVLDYLEECVS